MLDDLDKIDWSSLDSAYGPATRVPQMLRAAINAKDYKSFGSAYGDFINEVNHQDTVYEVTSYTVPFLLDLLKHEKDIERQEAHLITLVEFIKSARIINYFSRDRLSYPPIRYRHALAVHDAVCDGLDLYVSLLPRPEIGLSGLSMYLLTFLAGHHDRAVPPLQEYIQNQEHPHLRAGAIWGIARLWKEAGDGGEHQDREDWFKPFVENDPDQRVRAVSALAYVQLKYINRDWPAFIIKELAESLTYKLPYETEAHLGYFCFYQDAFLPFEGDWIRELGRAASFASNGLLIELVKQGKAPPRLMHRLVRELLNKSFRSTQLVLWGHPDPAFDREGALIYQIPDSPTVYHPGSKLIDYQQRALQAIIDCDSFWEIPTNLFSFFYGLPDEREALRELLT